MLCSVGWVLFRGFVENFGGLGCVRLRMASCAKQSRLETVEARRNLRDGITSRTYIFAWGADGSVTFSCSALSAHVQRFRLACMLVCCTCSYRLP